MTNHLMIDIETLGTRATSVVTQIGLCQFNENGIIKSTNLGLGQEGQHSRTACLATLDWWQAQINSPWLPLMLQISDTTAVSTLYEYVGRAEYIWAWSAHFDIAILQSWLEHLAQPIPWSHQQIIDARSFNVIKEAPPREKIVTHNGEEDAIQQARWVIELFKNKSFTF